jgi:hypothetical protein
VASGRARTPETDFLPQRSETLRESFQEKMRQKGAHRGQRSGAPDGVIRVVALSHGPHPEAESLHEGFLPGAAKLKVTLDLLDLPPFAEGIPPSTIPLLEAVFPNLLRHRCCGENDVHTTLFRRKPRSGCALPPADTQTDLCHLLEHLALELVVAMGSATRCSGLTCAHRAPVTRFDLFLECEDPRIGLGALRCAAHILHAVLVQGEPPAGALRYGETARYFLRRSRSVLNPGEVLADLQGDPVGLEEALRFLARIGFLVEEHFSFDFSGTTVYRYRLSQVLPAQPENIFF